MSDREVVGAELAGRTLMVLGGAPLQVPAIRKAKELGLEVVVLDMDPEAVGRDLADRFECVSTTDVPGIVDVALGCDPVGIVTTGTDMPMRAVAAVSERLGLHGPTVAAADRATDKWLMVQAFQQHGVSAPATAQVEDAASARAAVQGWGLPLICKPADSSGSRGVVLVEDLAELDDAVAYSRSYSRTDRVLLQEFLRGRELSIEGLCVGETPHLVVFTDKLTSGPPHFVEVGHSQPADLTEDLEQQVGDLVTRAALALGLRDCGIHGEVMITPDGPRMVEMGARLGGDFVTSHLAPLATGVDVVGGLIRIACGQTPSVEREWLRGAAIRFISPEDAAIDAARVAEALDVPGVVELGSSPGDGDRLRHSGSRLGHVIASGETAVDASRSCEQAMDILLNGKRLSYKGYQERVGQLRRDG